MVSIQNSWIGWGKFTNPTTLPNVGDERAKSWDMKAMIKFIMLSDAYKQKSSDRRICLKDWKSTFVQKYRMRLIGEVIRDQALFVGGLLVPKLADQVFALICRKAFGLDQRYGNLKIILLIQEKVCTVEVCIQYGKELLHLRACFYLMHPTGKFAIQSVQEPIRHYRPLLL